MHRRPSTTLGLSLMICALTACDGAPGEPPPDAAPDAAPTLQTLAACEESDFQGTPFMGPGFDMNGAPLGALPTPYVAATTAGWARPEPEHREALGAASEQISAAVFESPGLLGVSFGGSERCNTARTLSLWVDEDALDDFVWRAPHSASMSLVPTATLGWETTRWIEQAAEPPGWDRARRALEEARPAP